MKKKLGTVAERTKGKSITAIQVVQFAIEQAVVRISRLEERMSRLENGLRERQSE